MDDEIGANSECLVTPDALFKPADWLAKIDFIKQLVLLNNLLITVLAEHGGGKTSFIKLLQESEMSAQTHVFRASSSFSSSDIVIELANIFHQKVDSSTTMSSMIEHINQRNTHFLLIIDDAQNLPPAFLQEILTEIKRYERSMFFHICVVSDFKILQYLHKLETTEFENLIHTIELGALTKRETSTWLLNKSNVTSPVTNIELEKFYQLTGGSVARINSQMNALFEKECSLPISKFKQSLSIPSGQIISVLVASVFFTWFVQTSYFGSKQNIDVGVKEESAKVIESKAVEMASHSKIPAYFMASVIQPLQPSSRNLTIDYGDSDDTTLQNMVLMDKVVVLPNVVNAYHPSGSGIAVSSLPAIEIAKGKRDFSNEDNTIKNGFKSFTIQVLASKQPHELEKFVTVHHFNSQFKIALTKRNGIDWYVLTMGEFNKRELAQVAIDTLPAEVSKFKPWVRSTKELKVIG